MAIGIEGCKLLFYSKKFGVSYTNTLTLGRLTLYVSREEIINTINTYNTNEKKITEVSFDDNYSEPLFKILGAETIDSMDFSSYENATILQDLNIPFPNELKNKYTAVVDAGTIEHVFNFPTAIKSCMQALQIGGHYIGVTPANNQMGHGFYQFSPELYYRVFSDANGFKVKKMLIQVDSEKNTQWYEVADPAIVNNRVMLTNNLPISLVIIAEKISDKNIFETIPQQIDYVNTWDAHTSITENKIQPNQSRIKFLYKKLMPKRIKIILRNIYNIIFVEKVKDEFIGEFNPKHFIKTEI